MFREQFIVIVEPDKPLGQLLSGHIVALGHQAIVCLSAVDAISHLSQKEASAVILAWPEGKTREAQNDLAQLQTAVPHLPIILSIPPAFVRDAAELAQKIQGYLLRPFYFDEVAAQLRNVQQAQDIVSMERATIETLYAVQAEMVTTPDEPSVMEKISSVLVDVFGFDAAAFWVVDPDNHSGVLTLFKAQGIPLDRAEYPEYTVAEGQGIVGQVFETKQPLTVSDLTKYKGEIVWPELAKKSGWRSLMAVPMMFKHDALGVLACYANRVRSFTRLEQARLVALANLTSIDYKNAYQFQKWRLIERASEQLNQVRDLETAVSMIARNVVEIAEAVGATLCVYDAAKHSFLPEFSYHVGQVGAGLVDWANISPVWQPAIDRVFNDKKLLITDVRSAETRYLFGAEWQADLLAADVRALIGLRLDGNEDPVGLLFVYYVNLHPYANPDKNHEKKTPLNIYSEQAAAALGRAKFFRRRAEEQQFIQWFSRKVSIIPTRQDVEDNTWQETLLALCELTGAQRAMLGLRDEWGMMQFGVDTLSETAVSPNYLSDQVALGDKSIEGQVLMGKRPFELVRDLPQDKSWIRLANPTLGQTRSKLVAPILKSDSDERLGLIVLESDVPNSFDQLDLNLVTDLAGHIGIDVTGKQLENFGRHRIRHLESFIGDSYNFTAIQFVRERLEEMLNEIRQQEGYDIVSLHIYDPYWEQFEPPIMAGEFLSIDDFVYASRQALTYIPEQDAFFTLDPMRQRFVQGAFIEREEIEASALLRLRDEQKVVGLLFVYQRRPHLFDEAEKARLQKYGEAIRRLILESNFVRLLVSTLREALDLDIVRLHLYRGEPQPIWSHPVSSGQLFAPEQPYLPQKTAVGPIVRIIDRDEPSLFVPDAIESPLLRGNFILRERIRASGFVQLRMDDELLGILFVSRRRAERWKKSEVDAVRSFAAIAAVAIQNRRQLRAFKHKTIRLTAIQKASEEIVAAGLDLTAVANIVLSKAVALTRAHFATLRLLHGNMLHVEAVWGLLKDEEREWRRKYGRLSIDGLGLGPYLIKAASQTEGQNFVLVSDTDPDPYYLNTSGRASRSSLAVILRDVQDNQKPVGILSVEHPDRNGLDETDRDMLMLLANIAAVALKHARRREVVQTTEMIALQGLFGANWWHTAHQKSYAIKQRTHLLELYMKQPERFEKQIADSIREIETAAEEIDNIPTKGVLPSMLEEKAQPIEIDALLRQTVTDLCHNVPDVELVFQLNAAQRQVAIHPLLFDLALEKLVTNAVQAMGQQGQLQIRSEIRQRDLVEIQIIDSGPGIPPEIAAHFLTERIAKHSGEDGQGIGGLLARFVFNRYGGRLSLEKNTAQGVTLTILLPLVDSA